MENNLYFEVKECPFCGKKDALEFTDAKELEECTKFEDEECPCYEEEDHCYCKAIVCSIKRGGCGASSGYATSIEKVVQMWNMRAGEEKLEKIEQILKDDWEKGFQHSETVTRIKEVIYGEE